VYYILLVEIVYADAGLEKVHKGLLLIYLLLLVKVVEESAIFGIF
jgi:hypothetical protein